MIMLSASEMHHISRANTCTPRAYELWETLTPHAKCWRVTCVKGQRLQNRFGEELPNEVAGLFRGEMRQAARL